MKLNGMLLVSIALLSVAPGSRAADTIPKQVAERLATDWMATAVCNICGDRVVYSRPHSDSGIGWSTNHGDITIDGDILILSPTYAIACSHATLKADQAIDIEGLSYTYVNKSGIAAWSKYLILKK